MATEKSFYKNEKPGFTPVSHANPLQVIHLQEISWIGIINTNS